MGDTYAYGKTNANYWAEQYPGIFDNAQGSTKHASLSQPSKARKRVALSPLAPPRREGETLVITLPLPHRVLHKNGRTKNFDWKASLTKAARNAAKSLASFVRPAEQWQAVRIDATFWIANRNDDDGAWAYIAAYRDGIADALGLNDKHFTAGNVIQHTGKASEGRREVQIVVTKIP